MATVQRRLSVIVCADVVGYSRLMGSDEVGTLTALKAHREAIDPLFAEEGGRLVKTTGDGLLLEFPSAFHAVRASLSVQRLMADRNKDVPEEKRLVFRMGVHLGDVIVDDGDIFGDGVNIAARLQEIAEPGGICLSQAVHATIHKNIDALFRDGGSKVLKNIAAPVHVYNLALDGSAAVPVPATPPSVPLLSLIVLPFTNLSGDSRQDYLVDSVTDHLTAELARIESSFVVARNTALTYRGDALDVTEIGHELGVDYAIKGSARTHAGGLRINAQLIDTKTGQHLWVDRFDIAIGDAFAMQRDVVVRLIPPLHANLLAASGRAPQPAPTVLPQSPGDSAAARGVAMAHPRGGTVVYPRGVDPALVARTAAATAARPAPPPPASQPRPASPVMRATASAGVTSTSPAAQPVRQPAPFRIPFLVKMLVIAIAGGVALAMLGAERQSIVEIVSWMLIAAGSVQMISAFTASPRRG
jgi:class 3 adenylate cyclase/TolB-like protein